MGGVSQFWLLFRKNWILQKRKPIATTLEILLPTFFSLILIIIRQIVEIEYFDDPTTWENFSVDQFRDDLIPYSSIVTGLPTRWRLYYAPMNNVTDTIMAEVASRLDIVNRGKTQINNRHSTRFLLFCNILDNFFLYVRNFFVKFW